MGRAGTHAGRSPRQQGVLTVGGGLCVMAAWFLPWCTMHFGTGPAAPIVESPYALAAQAPGWLSADMLLPIALALIGLGAYFHLARRGALSRGDVLVLVLVAGALVAATYSMLGLMAVPQILAGHAAPSVYLVPGLGAIVMLAGLGFVAAACIRAWRRL